MSWRLPLSPSSVPPAAKKPRQSLYRLAVRLRRDVSVADRLRALGPQPTPSLIMAPEHVKIGARVGIEEIVTTRPFEWHVLRVGEGAEPGSPVEDTGQRDDAQHRLVSESAFLMPSVIHSPTVGSAVLSRFRGCTSSRLVRPFGLAYFSFLRSRFGTGRSGFHW